MAIQHGGDLTRARALYGLRPEFDPAREWVDLSTGIHPNGWTPPEIPHRLWQRLPQEDDGLEEAAALYYGVPRSEIVAVPGSQAAITLLPRILQPHPGRRVAVPHPEYAEHAAAWDHAGHEVIRCRPETESLGSDPAVRTRVLSNPNNPTGNCFRAARLQRLQQRSAQHGPRSDPPPRLIVDEAFADTAHADQSVTAARGNLAGTVIVLRSMGKFFGLAGARIGFVIADADVCQQVREALDPWAIAGPTRWVARQALRDVEWQHDARAGLKQGAGRLQELLHRYGPRPAGGTPLFQWCPLDTASRALAWQGALAEDGIWVRCFDEPPGLRFGLPGHEVHWERLAGALASAADGLG